MTGSTNRVPRAVAATLSVSLLAGTFSLGGSQADPPKAAPTEAQRAPTSPPQEAEETATLVLMPAGSHRAEAAPMKAPGGEITGELIMQLVAQAESMAEPEAEAKPSVELVAKLNDPAVQQALRLRGSRYRYGGTSRGGFDCSGFTRYVYARLGVSLPHSSAAQFQCGKPVSKGSLKPGDLVFFTRGGRSIGHVGIFVGNGRFVHASNPSRGVVVDALGSAYYARTYRGARRLRG